MSGISALPTSNWHVAHCPLLELSSSTQRWIFHTMATSLDKNILRCMQFTEELWQHFASCTITRRKTLLRLFQSAQPSAFSAPPFSSPIGLNSSNLLLPFGSFQGSVQSFTMCTTKTWIWPPFKKMPWRETAPALSCNWLSVNCVKRKNFFQMTMWAFTWRRSTCARLPKHKNVFMAVCC